MCIESDAKNKLTGVGVHLQKYPNLRNVEQNRVYKNIGNDSRYSC